LLGARVPSNLAGQGEKQPTSDDVSYALFTPGILMAIKKSDLYSSIWASCDELRGGMDASQYKDYVLFMLFIK
jgi:hypothetical protein